MKGSTAFAFQILLLSALLGSNNSLSFFGIKPSNIPNSFSPPRSSNIVAPLYAANNNNNSNNNNEPHPPDKPPPLQFFEKAADKMFDKAALFFANKLDDYVANPGEDNVEDEDQEEEEEEADVSIPYDAAAKLAYEASDESIPYDEFQSTYKADAIAFVKSKRPIDVSIPYDAAAKLAYEGSGDKSIPYDEFKTKYEADAIALVKSKNVKEPVVDDKPIKEEGQQQQQQQAQIGYAFDEIEPVQFEIDDETKENARKFYESIIKPISSMQAGVPADAIKGAALVGAALGVITTKGVVASSAASLSAAYFAITQGVLGDIFRTVGGITWDTTQAAATLYQKATASEKSTGMSKELAERVMASVDFDTTTTGYLDDEAVEEEEDLDAMEAELAKVLMEAESAISAADAAISAVDETMGSEEEEEIFDAEATMLEEEVRLAEEELQKAEEQARLLAEENARAEEEARLAEEARLEAERLEEERLRLEEEQLKQELLAAQEQVRLEEERVAAGTQSEEPEEEYDQDWEEAIAIAQEGLDGKIVGIEEAITDESTKREWDAAGALAQELQDGQFDDESPEITTEDISGEDYAYEYFVDEEPEAAKDKGTVEAEIETLDQDDDDDYMYFDDDNVDMEALAKAARDAVAANSMETVDTAEVTQDDDDDNDYMYFDDDGEEEEDGMDMEALAKAAREAVEKYEEQAEASDAAKQGQRDEWANAMVLDDEKEEEYSDFDADEEHGTEVDLTEERARATREAVARLGDDAEEIDDDEDNFDFFMGASQGQQDSPFRDWSALTVAKLRDELRLRGLKTYGKKAELVKLLEDYDAEQLGTSSNDDGGSEENKEDDDDDELMMDFSAADLDELGRQARAAVEAYGNEEDEDDSDDDWLNEFNEMVNMGNLGEQARAAVDAADEPSDEVLQQLEMEEPLLFEDVVPETTNYESMTVAQLKDELRGKGLRVSGRKAELIERLMSS